MSRSKPVLQALQPLQRRWYSSQQGRHFTPLHHRSRPAPTTASSPPHLTRSNPPPPHHHHPPPAPRPSPLQAQAIPGLQKKLEGYTTNRDITARWVQVRNAEGKLSSPQTLETVLSQIEPTTQLVRQLAPAGQGQTPDTAIVEVTEISTLLKQVAAREQAAKEVQKKAREAKPKQLELNWAISENDLELKMRQMEDFLDKGKKVELILAAKRRQRKATPEEAETLVAKLDERVEQAGAKKVKMEGKLLGQATITVQKK